MDFTRKFRPWLLLVLCSGLLRAQNTGVEPPSSDAPPSGPTVTFTLDFPGIQPDHFSVVVEFSGRAVYQSRTVDASVPSASGDPYVVKFTVSEAMRARIFELARRAHYFQGDFDFKKHRIAFTGNKTLAYADSGKRFETSYNWSENPVIEELTAIFQGISNTQESARRLVWLRRFDKLGLDSELKSMEFMARSNSLGEVQAIAPLLQEIASDKAVMHIARERAQRLLRLATGQTPSSP